MKKYNIQPIKSIDVQAVLHRARLLDFLRAFFKKRDVIEVLTPLLSGSTTPSPHTDSFSLEADDTPLYLQTSPEFGMKKLLAAGVGDCYQISSVFRKGEQGAMHAPEFIMCEYYRTQMAAETLMHECMELLGEAGIKGDFVQLHYAQLFANYLDMDIFALDLPACEAMRSKHHIDMALASVDDYLAYWFTHHIEPFLARDFKRLCVTQFPVSQKEFAKTDPFNKGSALRFEIYVNGVELANGYEEMQTYAEYHTQFKHMQAMRLKMQKEPVHCDQFFLDLLKQKPLPKCAGVSIGVERLLSVLE